MKTVISYNGLKRRIDGDFALCMSRRDAEILRDALNKTLSREEFSYGWFDVREPMKLTPDQSAIDWAPAGVIP